MRRFQDRRRLTQSAGLSNLQDLRITWSDNEGANKRFGESISRFMKRKTEGRTSTKRCIWCRQKVLKNSIKEGNRPCFRVRAINLNDRSTPGEKTNTFKRVVGEMRPQKVCFRTTHVTFTKRCIPQRLVRTLYICIYTYAHIFICIYTDIYI